MNIIKLLVLFTCCTLAGCYPTRQLTLTDFSEEVLELPFKFDSLTIADQRDSLLPMNWNLPVLGVKPRKWVGNPEISEQNRTDINRIIRQSGKADGVPVIVEFRVDNLPTNLMGK